MNTIVRRSCWRRVEDLEDEEASLNHRLMKLEKLRRRERLEVCTVNLLNALRDRNQHQVQLSDLKRMELSRHRVRSLCMSPRRGRSW